MHDHQRYVVDHCLRLDLTLTKVRRFIKDGSDVAVVGVSPFDSILEARFPECRFFYVLPSPAFLLESAMPTPAENRVLFFDLASSSGDPARQFDVVLVLEVMEHLFADDALVLSRIQGLTRNGGILILSLPNAATIGNRIRLLAGYNVFWPKHRILTGSFGGYGHIREYTFREAEKLITGKFELLLASGINGYRRGMARLFGILPKTFANTILVVARNRRGDDRANLRS